MFGSIIETAQDAHTLVLKNQFVLRRKLHV